MDGPTEAQFGLAQYSGRRWARRAPARGEPADAAQEACVILLDQWPKLTATYPDGVPAAIIHTVVIRRLTDRLRTETGWRHKVRPKPPVSIDVVFTNERNEWVRNEPIDYEADVEEIAMRSLGSPDLHIDRLMLDVVPRCRDRYGYIMREMAAGTPQSEIAAKLGITKAAVNKAVAKLRRLAA